MVPTIGKPKKGLRLPQTQKTSSPNGSHGMTLNPVPQSKTDLSEPIESNSHDFHLTASIKNQELGPRELALITEVLEYQIVHFGINLNMVLALTTLYFRLLGNKRSSIEINSGKIRLICTIAEIILSEIGSAEFSLSADIKLLLKPEVVSLLSPYLMTKRTYGSRYKTWRPEKFLSIYAVPVDKIIERDKKQSTERYSGYCKGYGESHPNAHRHKTKPSFELDGSEGPSSEQRNLNIRMWLEDQQPANQLWIKYTALSGKNL